MKISAAAAIPKDTLEVEDRPGRFARTRQIGLGPSLRGVIAGYDTVHIMIEDAYRRGGRTPSALAAGPEEASAHRAEQRGEDWLRLGQRLEAFEVKHRKGLLTELSPGSKVLFIRLRSLGDTILSTPLYAALKDWRPDLQLSALVEKPYDEVLLRNPDLRSVFCLPVNTVKQRSSLVARWQTLGKIRRQRFDCCINLHGGATSAWLTGMSKARYRIGLHSFRNSFCYNLRLKSPQPPPGIHWHSARFQLEWLHQLGLPEGPPPPSRLYPDPDLKPLLEARLREAGLSPSQPYCVIQPNSRFHTKEWTDSGFAEISDYLQNQHDCATLLVGAEDEASKIRSVSALCQTRPAAIWGLSISELTWVVGQASLFVGNDSGPTHLAAGLGVPTLVLFGSSDSGLWHPWQTTHEIVQNSFDCNPCPGYRCLVYDEPRCILSITPAQVKEALQRLLKRAQLPAQQPRMPR